MDNVNITVNETIENIVINPAITTEVIDVNITGTTETINIDVTPNLTTVNINSISGSPVTKTSDLINDGEDGVNPFITLNDIPAVTGFVPYTDATQDVNLGEFGVQLGNLEFDLTPTNAPTGVGSMVWNDTAGTLDLKLKGGAVTLQIGQETVARVVNKTATNITLLEANYQIVRVTGAQGQRPKVDLALANNDLNSTTTLGLVTETIANNQEGFITTSGQVQQINTTGSLQGETWSDGDVLYLSGTIAGQATNIKPIAPIHTVIIGFVEYAHITQGKIFVKVDNGYELEELHNVSAIAPNNNEVLTYDTPTLLWKPKTIASALGYTPFQLPSLTAGSVLFSDGTTIAQKNSNFFWDNTNNRLGIGTNSPTVGLETKGGFNLYTSLGNHYLTSTSVSGTDATLKFTRGAENGWMRFQLGFFQIASDSATGECRWNAPSGGFFSTFYSNGIERMRMTTTGNTLINTTTDNGGKLQIKAPGALSTDIALRVKNSADTGDLMTVNGLGNVGINGDNTITGLSSANQLSFRIGVVSNQGVSTRSGDFTIGFSSATALEGGRMYNNGTGYFWIDGYTEGASKTQNYPIIIGSRAASKGALVGSYTTQENGSQTYFGFFTAQPSAQVIINSTTRGFLPPRMTTTEKNAIATPASGLVVYDTTLGKLCVRGASAWETITSI